MSLAIRLGPTVGKYCSIIALEQAADQRQHALVVQSVWACGVPAVYIIVCEGTLVHLHLCHCVLISFEALFTESARHCCISGA